MNELVAVIEDEADLASLTAEHLRRDGFRVETFGDAERFFRFLAKKRPDLVVLDLMLPDMGGLDVCRALKRSEDWRTIPIIMATARADAVLRRSRTPDAGGRIAVGQDLVLDSDRFEARWKGELLELTSTEFRILHLLAAKRGRVLTREQILDELWGHEKIVLDRTVDVHIKNLRDKLGPAATLVKNIRGVGYKVEP
jgi:DNA-binding response OmpR family regulator